MGTIYTPDEAKEMLDVANSYKFNCCKKSMIGELNSFLSSHPKGGIYLYATAMYRNEMKEAAKQIIPELVSSGWHVRHKSVNRYRMYGVTFYITATSFESMSFIDKIKWWLTAEE